MDFLAIDVETANADMASICQIGIARFSDGLVCEEWKSYVNPEDYFDPVNVEIHGIDEDKVSDAPNLPNIVPTLLQMLTGKVVVCHTHFDRSAIHRSFEKHEVQELNCTWLDTAMVARRTWPEFSRRNYGLTPICEKIGYHFQHHDALEDAKAAGMVLLEASKVTQLDLNGWLHRVRQPIDPLALGANGSVALAGNREGPIQGEVLVFTGALSIPRRDAAVLAARVGCNVGDSVTKATTILVVGDQDIRRLNGQEKSSKHRKAEELIAHGQHVRIIKESDFQKLVESADST